MPFGAGASQMMSSVNVSSASSTSFSASLWKWFFHHRQILSYAVSIHPVFSLSCWCNKGIALDFSPAFSDKLPFIKSLEL